MKQIILVEDDPGILDPMIIILRNSGYAVTTFLDGVLILNNDFSPPDLFIIDKQLPGVDGLEICKYLKSRKETSSIPVIMVSATPNIHTLGKAAGADDTIEKPFQIHELRDVVAKHLTR